MTDKSLYKKTDGVLFNYKSIKAEISNLELDIEEIKSECEGCKAIGYDEKTGPTNAFNSTVENEVLKKEKILNKLIKEKRSKERLITKIDNALEPLEEIEKKIVELRCFKRYNWSKVGALLNMDGDYCGKIKRDIINEIAPVIWPGQKYAD